MLPTTSPIPFPAPSKPQPLSPAAQRVLDLCPALRPCSTSPKLAASTSPLAIPSTPTLAEYFSPAADRLIPPLSIMGFIARSTLLDSSPVFWIGRRTWPTPWLLSLLNLPHSIFIDPPHAAATLWSIDQSLRTGGTRAIIADGTSLDMSATRRIQLACESANAHCLLARPDFEMSELSAAAIRWHVSPAISDNDLPAWSMKLLRDKRSTLFAGMDSPAWIIRTMRFSHTQPQPNHETLNFPPCPLHLSAQLVNTAGNSAHRSRFKSLSP